VIRPRAANAFFDTLSDFDRAGRDGRFLDPFPFPFGRYPLHIILRYEVESALVEGSLAVADVPAVWNAKMQEYLGVTPADDAQGCLQDVHWSAGLFGYFPTYTLGAMMAVQIYDAAAAALPGLEAQVAAGEFKPLREWLRTNVHEVGSLYPTADELLVAVTGKPLDPAVFMRYLSAKYKKLYKLA
jgi:carboxypeptidase Taq